MAKDKVRTRRCAIYTRKSSEEGLDQDFNSLDAQREACTAYVQSQVGEGWKPLPTLYNDGGFSGGSMDRPALEQLLADIRARKVDTVVVYKVDRLTRSLSDFARIVEVFDQHTVSFVSVTQQFNTTTSMGRLTLNMLLSFAQFEREVTGERIRDKIAASKAKGMWMGGFVPLGYEPDGRTLVINEPEAETVRRIFRLYLELGTVREVKEAADELGLVTKLRETSEGHMRGGRPLSRGYIYKLLGNPLYAGRISHKGKVYPGQHPAIIDPETWEAVQAHLKGNASSRPSQNRKTASSPLMGKLYDEEGQPLTPSHAVKGNRRYRYYVSRHLLEGTANDSHQNPGWRLPANEIENAVQEAVRKLLRDQAALAQAASEAGLPANCIAVLLDGGTAWVDRAMELVSRVELASGSFTVQLDLSEPAHHPGLEIIHVVAARIKRRGVEMRLVLDGPANTSSAQVDESLIKAIVRARRWFAALTGPDPQSLGVIASVEKVTDRYVARLLPLALLSPEIVTSILRGTQPPDLTVEALTKNGELPTVWSEQEAMFDLG